MIGPINPNILLASFPFLNTLGHPTSYVLYDFNVDIPQMAVTIYAVIPLLLIYFQIRIVSSDTGVIIPLYKYPDSINVYSRLISAALKSPNLHIVAIMNPFNGPSASVNLGSEYLL